MRIYIHFQIHKGPFFIFLGPFLNIYWGNSGFELRGLILEGYIIGEGLYIYKYRDIYIDIYLQGSIKDPNAAEKEPQLS